MKYCEKCQIVKLWLMKNAIYFAVGTCPTILGYGLKTWQCWLCIILIGSCLGWHDKALESEDE